MDEFSLFMIVKNNINDGMNHILKAQNSIAEKSD